MNQKAEFWAAWKALQAELQEARSHGCVRPVHFHAAELAWEKASLGSLQLPQRWEDLLQEVEEGRRYLRYR